MVSLSALCVCTQISLPNGSRELKKLSDLALVEKYDAQNDKRKQLIKLSQKGQVLILETYETIQSLVFERYKDLSDEDLKVMTGNLMALSKKLK